MYLYPSQIRYSHDSIACKFGYGSHNGRPIGETLDDLLCGRCTVDDIPTITVTFQKGHWYCGDNRRLWLFQKAEELGIIDQTIEVKKGWVRPYKFTTNNEGVSIEIRGDPGGRAWRKKLQKKRATRDPSSPKTVKPLEPASNLPPLRTEERRENISIIILNEVRLDNTLANPYNDYKQYMKGNPNQAHQNEQPNGNSDTMSRKCRHCNSNPAFAEGKDSGTVLKYGDDEDETSSDGNWSTTANVGDNHVSSGKKDRDQNTRVNFVDHPVVWTTRGTTTPDVEAGGAVSYRRCPRPTIKRAIVGIIITFLVILIIVLIAGFVFFYNDK